MMRLIISIGALLFGVRAQVQAGLKTSVDIDVLNQAKEVYFDTILKAINNLSLPDITDDDGNYLKENSFEITESQDQVTFTTDVAENAIILANKKISGEFKSGSFRYKVAPLVVAKGHARVDLNTIEVDVGIKFMVKELRNGKFVPRIDTVDVYCEINRFDINIHLFGNLVTDIGSLFEVFFVGTVAGMIEDTIKLTINQVVPLVANNVIDSTNGVFPISAFVPFAENWWIDWQTPEAAVVTDTNIGVGIKGLFYDNEIGEEEPAVAIP